MYTITVSEKGGQQSIFEFNKPEVTIGRMKGNDIVLPKGNVSKRHSRIFAQDGGFSIMDLDSTNGTYVNGRRIQGEQDVAFTDKIYIGDFILQIETEAVAAAPPPAPGHDPMANGGPAPPPGPPGPPGPPNQEPWNPASSDPVANGSGLQMQGAPMPASDPIGSGTFGSGFNPSPEPPADPPPPEDVYNQSVSPFSSPPSSSVPPAPADDPPIAGDLFSPSEDMATPSPDLGGLAPSPLNLSQPNLGNPPSVAPRIGTNPPPSVQINVSAFANQRELESDFDEDFHAAQLDVTRVLFEKLDAASLPGTYPPESGELDRYASSVESAVNTVNPTADRDVLIDLIAAECVGLGPIEMYLDDDEIDAIYVHRYDQVMVRRGGQLVRAKYCFSNPDFLSLATERLFGPADPEKSFDEVRFEDGTKIAVCRPPLTEAPVLTFRKSRSSHPTLDELTSSNVMAPSMAEFLRNAVAAGQSILVAGPSDAGKTTLVSALAKEIGDGARVVAVEQHRALDLPEFAIRFDADRHGKNNARAAIRAALSTRPHRLILDECQGEEAYDWVTSAACGTDGSLISIHGMNARDALGRLETLALLGAGDANPRGLREQIARSVGLVVVVNRTLEGWRVQQIADVQGVDLDAYRMQDVYYFRTEGGTGSFHPTGHIPLFYEDLRHAGIDVDFGVFRE